MVSPSLPLASTYKRSPRLRKKPAKEEEKPRELEHQEEQTIAEAEHTIPPPYLIAGCIQHQCVNHPFLTQFSSFIHRNAISE